MIRKSLPLVLGILLIAGFAIKQLSSAKVTEDILALENKIRLDYKWRGIKYVRSQEERAKLNYWILEKGLCPSGSVEIIIVELPASGGYTDIANTAYYCSSTNVYWVRHIQGALIGTGGDWLGPYKLWWG